METGQQQNFEELAMRLAAFATRTFAEFSLGGRHAAVRGTGLSLEDFVWRVLGDYAAGKLAHETTRGELFSLLATALRNDIIDALRRQAHLREEGRSVLGEGVEQGSPSLDELAGKDCDLSALLDEESYCNRVRTAFRGEPELAEMVRAVFDLNLAKPKEIAEALGISTEEVHNRKKRLRRRLVEYHLVAEETL